MRNESNSIRLNFATVRELLDYDPLTGEFIWLVDRSGVTKAGMRAGRTNGHGYREIRILGPRYQSHRLAFIFMLNEWPESEVDHLNGDRSDNRWVNLRQADRFVNARNSITRPNKNGYAGITEQEGRFYVKIYDDGQEVRLGSRVSLEEAVDLRKKGEKVFGYTERHGMR